MDICPYTLYHIPYTHLQAVPVQRSAINQPTWTGHSGAAGAPPVAAPRRFGTTVNPALRAALNAQQQASGSGDGASAGAGGPPPRFGAGGMVGVTGGRARRSSDLLDRMRQRVQQATAAGDEVSVQVHLAGIGSRADCWGLSIRWTY